MEILQPWSFAAIGIVCIVAVAVVAFFASVKAFELSLRSLGFPLLLFPFCSVWVWEAGQERADEEIYCDRLETASIGMQRYPEWREHTAAVMIAISCSRLSHFRCEAADMARYW